MLRKPAKRRAAGVRRSCAARRACLSRGSGKLPVRSVLTVASATAGSTKAALRQPDPPHALDPRRRDSASASSGTRARRRAAGVAVRALARRGRVPRRFGQAVGVLPRSGRLPGSLLQFPSTARPSFELADRYASTRHRDCLSSGTMGLPLRRQSHFVGYVRASTGQLQRNRPSCRRTPHGTSSPGASVVSRASNVALRGWSRRAGGLSLSIRLPPASAGPEPVPVRVARPSTRSVEADVLQACVAYNLVRQHRR